MARMEEVTRKELVRDLKALGLFAGIKIMVHSSLKAFRARVERGPQTVIQAIMEVVTPEGTLMFPSFNHGIMPEENGEKVFDISKTASTNGAIPDAFWRMEGVYRSLNPTHSFACWGKGARDYVAGHHRTLTVGPDSPLGHLYQDGGYGLMLGLAEKNYEPNTFHHLVENYYGSPCLGKRTQAYRMRLPDGRLVEGRTWSFRERPCPMIDGRLYGDVIGERGLDRRGKVGGAASNFFKMSDAFEVITEVLDKGIGGHPPCNACPIRPTQSDRTCASDWDQEAQSLKSDSPSWDY